LSIAIQANNLVKKYGEVIALDGLSLEVEQGTVFGLLGRLPKKEAVIRANDLLERFNLNDAAKRIVKTYSGGMRRRLDLAASLIAKPNILFLDEPTTGLDPRSRLMMWDVIQNLVNEGTTVLLTTQYLEEADQLAKKIAVIDKGKVIAQGSADELKTQVGGERIEVVVSASQTQAAAQALQSMSSGKVVVEGEHVQVPVSGGGVKVVEAVRALDIAKVEIKEIQLRRPTLDDVFLSLTGHHAEEIKAEEDLAPKKGRR